MATNQFNILLKYQTSENEHEKLQGKRETKTTETALILGEIHWRYKESIAFAGHQMSTISFLLHKSSEVMCELEENKFRLCDFSSNGLEIPTNGTVPSLAQLTKPLADFLKKGNGREWGKVLKHDAKFAVQAFYVSIHYRHLVSQATPDFIEREDFIRMYDENSLFCSLHDSAKIEELVKCHNVMVAALKVFPPKKELFAFIAEVLSTGKLSFETGGSGKTACVGQRYAIYEQVSGVKPAASTRYTVNPPPAKGTVCVPPGAGSARSHAPRSTKRPRSRNSLTDESDTMSEITTADDHKHRRRSGSSVYSKEELEFPLDVFDDEERGVEQRRCVSAVLVPLLDDETTLPSDGSVSDDYFDVDEHMSGLDSAD